MPYSNYSFPAFAEADLTSDGIRHGASFTLPAKVPLTFNVSDNDSRLSSDIFDNAADFRGQQASISQNGDELGNDRQVYVEQSFHVSGSDGKQYRLVEIEQEGSRSDYFTFAGDVPPAGTELTVGRASNMHAVSYDNLGAGSALPNIVDIAAGSDDFNILVQALGTTGLVEAVRGSNDTTVFAPTDAAFTQLAVDLGFTGDTSDKDAVFGAIADALAGLAPDGNPIPLLSDILLYHVSPEAKTAAEVAAEGQITTLTDKTFGSLNSQLIDNEPDVANPNIIATDIEASNGIIQGFDRVLLPIDVPGNTEPLPSLTEIVASSGGEFDSNGADFDLLLNAVKAADLAGALDDPNVDLTVFAPNDAAFVGLAQTLGFEGRDEGEAFSYIVESLTLLSGGGDPISLLTDNLLYHVAPNELGSDAVLGSDSIDTLLGTELGVNGASLVDRDPDLKDSSITDVDIQASNGVAHVLDGVLIPVDLFEGDGDRGRVDRKIGDEGKDHFRTGDNTDFVSGLGGNDKIKLGAGDDVGLGGDGNDKISGGSGNDRIDGGAGRDQINGGRGDDNLVGGADADVFKFFSWSGDDIIEDFVVGKDMLSIRKFGVKDFDDIDHRISDGENGAEIDLGRVDITLEGVSAGSLTESDFIFS